MSKKIIIGIAVVALIIVGMYVFRFHGESLLGAIPGSNPIENYVPAILYNGGYYSALPIQTTSDITGATITGTATSTFADVTMTSNATTSLKILSSSSYQGGCVQMNATSTATNIRLMFSTIATSTYNGYVTWSYGTCE